jgi:hypothetical protein
MHAYAEPVVEPSTVSQTGTGLYQEQSGKRISAMALLETNVNFCFCIDPRTIYEHKRLLIATQKRIFLFKHDSSRYNTYRHCAGTEYHMDLPKTTGSNLCTWLIGRVTSIQIHEPRYIHCCEITRLIAREKSKGSSWAAAPSRTEKREQKTQVGTAPKMGRNYHRADWVRFQTLVNTNKMKKIAKREMWTELLI